jgi:thymidylate synthase
MQTKSLFYEVLWYLSGDDHIRNLRKQTKIWDAWSDENGNLETAYGRYWRRFPSAQVNPATGKYEVKEIDQIAEVIHLLKTNPTSRRMVVSAWEPGNALHSKLPPCHNSTAISHNARATSPSAFRLISQHILSSLRQLRRKWGLKSGISAIRSSTHIFMLIILTD